MKRLTAWIVSGLLMLTLFGCGTPEPRTPAEFYYRRQEITYESDRGVIDGEIRDLADFGDMDQILSAYFAGPESNGLESPFPRDTAILSREMDGNTLILTMSPGFGVLSGVELSIACTCIAKTVLGLIPAEQVRFRLADGLLGGEKSITFSQDNMILYDNSLDQSRTEFTLYYTDRQQRYLIGETVSVNLATEEDLVTFLVKGLMDVPEDSMLLSAIPANTQLLDYTIDGGLCTLNFSEEFERNGWSRCQAQRLTLLSIVNALTQLEQIQQVEFCIEGNLLVKYRQLSIPAPLVYEEAAIGPVRTGMNEFDATLYLVNGPEQYLAPVPTPVRQTSGYTQAELVVMTLLEHTNINGFYSRIPEGTRLNALHIRSGVCYIDLSAEFLSSQDHLVQSIHSIAASVCALEDIDRVQITVDGLNPRGEYADLFGILTPQSDWFL